VRVTAPDGYAAVRSYSIASASNRDSRIEMTIERLPDGEVSPYLTREVAIGDRLELRGPIGGWFVWHSRQIEPVQLVAGGSGIVPLIAMIRARASAGSTAPFRLLYSVRDPRAVWYRDELHALGSRRFCGCHVCVHTSRSDGLAAAAWLHRRPADRGRQLAVNTWPNVLRVRPYIVRRKRRSAPYRFRP